MPRINYRIPNFTLFVGGLDCTDYLDAINLSAPQSEPDSPLFWSGDFQVSFNRKAIANGLSPSDFDPLTSALRWRPGLALVQLTIEGYPFPALRIERYTYNPQTRQGQGTLTQILALLSSDRPAIEPEIEVGRSVPLAEVVDKLIAAAYEGATLPAPPRVLAGITGELDSPISTRDPIADAQKICGVNWHWLAVDAQERAITVSGKPSDRPLVFSRSIDAVEWEPDLDAINFAAEKIIVTGSRQVIDDSIDCSDKEPNPNADEQGRPKRVPTKVEEARGKVFPQVSGDSTPITSSEKVILYAYNNSSIVNQVFTDGFSYQLRSVAPLQAINDDLFSATQANTRDIDPNTPIRTMTILDQPRAIVFPDLVEEIKPSVGKPYFAIDDRLTTAEVTIETPFLRSVYKPRGIVTPDPKIPKDSTQRLELVLDRREYLEGDRVSKRPDHGGGINPRTGRAQCLEQPPAPEPRQNAADVRLKTEAIKGECQVAPSNWTPLQKRPLIQDFGFIPSQSHADNLACQIAYREAGRRDAVQVTMPLPIEWMAAGFPLLCRCRIHDAEFLIDGPIVSIADGQAKFSFSGTRLGQLTPAVPPIPNYQPYVASGGLQLILRSGPIPAIANTPIAPVQFAANSTSATFSSPNLPPGLALSPNGMLSGAISANAAVTIVATDGTNSASGSVALTATPATLTPLITEIVEMVEVSRSFGEILEVGEPIVLSSRSTLTELEVVVADPIVELSTPIIEVAPPFEIIEISRPTLTQVDSAAYSPVVVAPLGSAGLANLVNTYSDFDSFALPDIGFDWIAYGTNYRANLHVGTFGYLTFGYGSTESFDLGPSFPGAGLFVGGGTSTLEALWGGAGPIAGSYRLRFEGYYGSQAPSLSRVWEVTLFADGALMLVTGVFDGTGDGYNGITNGSTSNNAYTITADSSLVFIPNPTGYQIQTGSYA
jgi:hypothetical protein